MTSEQKPDEHICEFVGERPTNSTTGEHKTVCKFQDITLIYNASQFVKLDKIKEIIFNRDPYQTI
jgi:uracil DNA glycosylase